MRGTQTLPRFYNNFLFIILSINLFLSTLDNKTKAKVPEMEPAEKVAAASSIKSDSTSVPVEPLSPEELKQMLSQAKESEDDDCLMCGS
jgi:ribonucleoside-diphosphate reductase alpha chain